MTEACLPSLCIASDEHSFRRTEPCAATVEESDTRVTRPLKQMTL